MYWENFLDNDKNQIKLMRDGQQVGVYRFSDQTYWPVRNGRIADFIMPVPIEPPTMDKNCTSDKLIVIIKEKPVEKINYYI